MRDRYIKTAVIGLGHLGTFHLEQLLQIAEARVVGAFDIDETVNNRIHEKYGIPIMPSLEATFSEAEAVTVAVPTSEHFTVARQALEAGCHVFIEKPITQSLEQADQLLHLAEKQSRLIQVGHIERFNPAARVLERYHLEPRFIEGHRLAPFTPRGTDVPVVLDLMIHDIDVVLSLVKSPVVDIRANGVQVITHSPDIATARLEFENGAVANLTASRISQKQMRKLRIFQSRTYISIDYLQKLTEIYRLASPGDETSQAVLVTPFEFDHQTRLITYEKPEIPAYNALRVQLENFIRSAAGLETPLVDGHSARAALDVAIRIEKIIARYNSDIQSLTEPQS